MRFAVLVSGRGSNLESLAKCASKKRFPGSIALVLCNKPNAPGLEIATGLGLATAVLPHNAYSSRPAYDQALVDILRAYSIDWVLLAGFMRILSPVMVDAFPNRIVNIHPSLLPAFPGLHPQQQALDAGVTESGCTVHLVDGGVDTGRVLGQRRVRVKRKDDAEQLAARILKAEHKLYPKVMTRIARGLVDVDAHG